MPKESAATEDGGDREGTDLLGNDMFSYESTAKRYAILLENLDVLEEEGVHLSAASGVGIRRVHYDYVYSK